MKLSYRNSVACAHKKVFVFVHHLISTHLYVCVNMLCILCCLYGVSVCVSEHIHVYVVVVILSQIFITYRL